ncbi:protein NPAT-like [Xyrauchen texanus]|uniref:protein NPAT-like n=1 Tax=Xyrauchen texanus TaxID=154827 RepID=UPI002241B07A|nr:protein NPAT-like [Xyrauchen texanus]XP_051963041.1 protein NPAT-like [Xyrauchen texanus]
MLLPSDVARLVLGYLQQEGHTATSRCFIFESPNLKEYAEHSSEDGPIPACVFSLFGKNLNTILNEYVAGKTKETNQENQIPAVMTSLWKKLEFTLNQIKSLQNSPTVQINQRLRTINSIQSMRPQQRLLSASQSTLSGNLPVTQAGQCLPSPVSTPQGMLGHSTPVSYTSHHTRPSTLCLAQSGESSLQILVPDQRLNPGPLSPARRKCDSPRRRGGGQLGASGTSRSMVVASTLIVETQCDETVAENLSQIVIENARDKILNDRSLQEKLAENINKILASDNSPQTSKAACSTVEQEQSIEEILGLQGEIHMTDDTIQDILVQTESDPAFQALFDLFDYEKSKTPEGSEQADRSFSSSTLESDEMGHVDSVSETGTGHEGSTSGGEGSASKLRNGNASETNSKKSSSVCSVSKSAAITPQPCSVTKQTSTGQGSSIAKRGLLRTRVLSGNQQTRGAISTPKLNGEADSLAPDQTVSSSSFLEDGAIMEIDKPQIETSDTLNIQHPLLTPPGCSDTTEILNDKSSQHVTVSDKPPQTTSTAKVNKSINETGRLAGMPGGHSGLNLDMTKISVSTIQSKALPSPHLPQPDMDISARMASQTSNKSYLTPSCTPQKDSALKHTEHNNVRSNPSTASASSAASITLSTSGVSHAQAKDPDPSKFVSLNIIISNEQDEQSNDVALNQAVSSITGDHIPSIFLSSPAKSPATTLPTSVITQEKTAQVVSSLQGPEDVGSFGIPTMIVQSKAQTTPACPTGQETGFIQLLPTTPTFGSSGGYFVLTDPAAGDQQSNVVLLPSNMPQGTVSSMPHVVATPPRQRTVVSMSPNVSQAYSTGSTIIISSPVQTMLQNVMVPVSVMGQNTGKHVVRPNQMLSLPCSTTVRQPAKVISQPKLAPKENTDMGKPDTSGPSQVSKVHPQTSDLQKSGSGTSPSHRRILCFDVTPENTAAGQSSTETSTFTSSVTTSSPTQQADKEIKRTEPNPPLVSDTSKRRIETIRLPQVNHSAGIKDSATITISQQQKEAPKSKMSEKGTDLTANKSPTKPESFYRSDLHKKSSDKVDGRVVSKSTKLSARRQKQKPLDNTKNSTQEESHERRLTKPSDQSSEKISSQESPGVTANKENELEGLQREQRQATSCPPTEDLVASTVKSAAPISGTSNKPLCKTSPLMKRAVEMLQDIQCQAPMATPPKRQGPSCPDLSIPRTPGQGRATEELTAGLRTPSRQRLIRECEGTPRCLALPATPDIPSCSPASEAGSENSINMAAHTLMILSRAARTGGPLKDSLRQEEASAGKSSAPKGKKRKHIEPSPPAKNGLQLSGSSDSKKKSKKPKQLLDSFPDDLDVDKFLSSLHYDE